MPDALLLELLLADWTAVHQSGKVVVKSAAWRAAWSPILDKHMPLTKVQPDTSHPRCSMTMQSREV